MHFNQDDINTGERLRGIRESMKMNREEFSEKIDITDSFLGQIERGERALSVKTLRKVVKYTGVSADYLLFGKDTNNETIQKINNILTVNSAETSDFIYHIVMYSNDFCKKLNKEQNFQFVLLALVYFLKELYFLNCSVFFSILLSFLQNLCFLNTH